MMICGPRIAPHSQAFSQILQVLHSDQRLMRNTVSVRQDAEERAERTEKPAVQIADEHRGDEQRREHRQQHRRPQVQPEHPERLDVRIDPRIAGDEEVDDHAAEDAVLDPGDARRSSARGTLMRHFAGSTRSINCVSAPNAQMRPQ